MTTSPRLPSAHRGESPETFEEPRPAPLTDMCGYVNRSSWGRDSAFMTEGFGDYLSWEAHCPPESSYISPTGVLGQVGRGASVSGVPGGWRRGGGPGAAWSQAERRGIQSFLEGWERSLRRCSRDTNLVPTGVFQEPWNWEELGHQPPGRTPPGGDRRR